jgi:hypothetical protein
MPVMCPVQLQWPTTYRAAANRRFVPIGDIATFAISGKGLAYSDRPRRITRHGGTGMKLPRRQFLHLAAGIAALPVGSGIARAQAYPTRPVRMIVGFPAGNASDIIARVVAQALSDRLGQQFVVENRPGATGTLARCLNSLPMPKPTRARSIWRRPAAAAQPTSSANCSR